MLDKSDMVDEEKEESVQEPVRDGDKEKLEPDQDDSKEEESIPDDGKKEEKIQVNEINLNWHSGTKLSKVGRPRESKIKFRK